MIMSLDKDGGGIDKLEFVLGCDSEAHERMLSLLALRCKGCCKDCCKDCCKAARAGIAALPAFISSVSASTHWEDLSDPRVIVAPALHAHVAPTHTLLAVAFAIIPHHTQ